MLMSGAGHQSVALLPLGRPRGRLLLTRVIGARRSNLSAGGRDCRKCATDHNSFPRGGVGTGRKPYRVRYLNSDSCEIAAYDCSAACSPTICSFRVETAEA